jgi:hypothetical protein
MTSTEVAIASQTLGSAASSITFSSIPATYTDLRVVWTGTSTVNTVSLFMRFNADTGTNYSNTLLYGDGSTAGSFRNTSITYGSLLPAGSISTTVPTFATADIFSYAGNTFKTWLDTGQDDRNGSGNVSRSVGLWRSTSAITEVLLRPSSGNFAIGTTATLYGIL